MIKKAVEKCRGSEKVSQSAGEGKEKEVGGCNNKEIPHGEESYVQINKSGNDGMYINNESLERNASPATASKKPSFYQKENLDQMAATNQKSLKVVSGENNTQVAKKTNAE